MGRRKKTDEKSAKPIRGPGRKSRKQGEPTFPKELMAKGTKYSFSLRFFRIKYFHFRIYGVEESIKSWETTV